MYMYVFKKSILKPYWYKPSIISFSNIRTRILLYFIFCNLFYMCIKLIIGLLLYISTTLVFAIQFSWSQYFVQTLLLSYSSSVTNSSWQIITSCWKPPCAKRFPFGTSSSVKSPTRVNRDPPTSACTVMDGWMVSGQQTIFCSVPVP